MSKDFDEWFEDHQDTYQLQQWREARMCANEAWSYQQAEIERLNTRLSVLQSAADHAFHDAALDNEMYAAIVGHKQ